MENLKFILLTQSVLRKMITGDVTSSNAVDCQKMALHAPAFTASYAAALTAAPSLLDEAGT